MAVISSLTGFTMMASKPLPKLAPDDFEGTLAMAGLGYLMSYSVYSFLIQMTALLIILFLSFSPAKYQFIRISFPSLFTFTRSMWVNSLMVIVTIFALIYTYILFANIYYPLWTKGITLLAVMNYYIWILQIVKERRALL